VAHNAGAALLLLINIGINHRLYLSHRYAMALRPPAGRQQPNLNTMGGLELPRA